MLLRWFLPSPIIAVKLPVLPFPFSSKPLSKTNTIASIQRRTYLDQFGLLPFPIPVDHSQMRFGGAEFETQLRPGQVGRARRPHFGACGGHGQAGATTTANDIAKSNDAPLTKMFRLICDAMAWVMQRW